MGRISRIPITTPPNSAFSKSLDKIFLLYTEHADGTEISVENEKKSVRSVKSVYRIDLKDFEKITGIMRAAYKIEVEWVRIGFA